MYCIKVITRNKDGLGTGLSDGARKTETRSGFCCTDNCGVELLKCYIERGHENWNTELKGTADKDGAARRETMY